MRLGLIGLGHVAGFQLPAIAAVPGVELIAACDADAAREEVLRLHEGGRRASFTDDTERFVREVEADVVMVATSNDTHFPIARALLRAGRNVALEKPATTTRQELDELCDVARREGRLLFFALHQSFGLDVQWFREHYRDGGLLRGLGPITGIHCGYYDPYVIGESLVPAARSLGGSWADSGINALSTLAQVVGIDRLSFDHACLTRVPGLGCSEVQGTAHFRVADAKGRPAGRAVIDTNWSLGLNCKYTRLDFAACGVEVVLHHSREQILQRSPDGASRLLVDLSSGRPRLVSHYIGVFREIARGFAIGQANTQEGRVVHEMLYVAAENGGGPAPCH